jgi:hypothetical protein
LPEKSLTLFPDALQPRLGLCFIMPSSILADTSGIGLRGRGLDAATAHSPDSRIR